MKNPAVIVKEEKKLKPVLAPPPAPFRAEESVLRHRKDSNGTLYARKIQDSSLNTTGRRDSLKRKAPGVSVLK